MNITDPFIIVAAVVTIITAVSTLIGWAYKLGRRKAQKDFHNKALQNRYKLIYVPLRTMLLEKHITTVVAAVYPRMSQRIRRAWPYLREFNLKYGLTVLFNKYGKPASEIEFGGHFPLMEIKQIIERHGEWADSKLLSLIQGADRSRYDGFDQYESLLTEEELALADHIWDMYHRLNKRLLPK